MNNFKIATPTRRFAAIFYDSFLIAALLIFAALPVVLINGGIIRDGTLYGEIKNIVFFIYLCWVVFIFYGWCWTHGGQTLGMAAWGIYVKGNKENEKVSWAQALLRYVSACAGLANIHYWFSGNQLCWHEKLSNTKTLYKPKT